MTTAQPSVAALDQVDASALGESYVVDGILGEGTFGIVFRARSRQTGAYYAIKKLRLDGFTEGVPATAIREITLLQELNAHPNIVKLLQVVCRKHRLYLVFELMAEDLRAFLQRCRRAAQMGTPPPVTAAVANNNHGSVPPPVAVPRSSVSISPSFTCIVPLKTIKSFTKQMLHALWCCHQNRIVHRDLKPGNLLIDDATATGGGLVLKLADFGLARTFELPLVTYTNDVVTLWYRAPEVLLGEKHYTPAVDIWSVGCIVCEQMTGKPLFRGESQVDQLQKIFEVIGTPTEETWPGVAQLSEYRKNFPNWRAVDISKIVPQEVGRDGADFVKQLLTPNPKDRPSANEALSHPWLADAAA